LRRLVSRFEVLNTRLPGVLLLNLAPLDDQRGWFVRHYCQSELGPMGVGPIKQANLVSTSHANVFRGFHFQIFPSAESKTFSCLVGKVRMFAVDLRMSSPTFLKSTSAELSEEHLALFVTPPGVAVGYLSLTDRVLLHYYSSAEYDPSAERGFRWNDPLLSDVPPLDSPVVSLKDSTWSDLSLYNLERLTFE